MELRVDNRRRPITAATPATAQPRPFDLYENFNLESGNNQGKNFFEPDCLDAKEQRTSVIQAKDKVTKGMLASVEPLDLNSMSPRDKIITNLHSPRPNANATNHEMTAQAREKGIEDAQEAMMKQITSEKRAGVRQSSMNFRRQSFNEFSAVSRNIITQDNFVT